MTDTSEQAAKDRAQAQLTKAMADMVTQVSLLLFQLLSQGAGCGDVECRHTWSTAA